MQNKRKNSNNNNRNKKIIFNNNLLQEDYQKDLQIYKIPHQDNRNQLHKEQAIKVQILIPIENHKINNKILVNILKLIGCIFGQ